MGTVREGSAKAARRLIHGLLPKLEGVEVYPKQDQLSGDVRVGSLVRGTWNSPPEWQTLSFLGPYFPEPAFR